MEDLLLVIARALVDKPDAVRVEADNTAQDGLIVYRLIVDDADIGRVIGKQGRIAKSIRQIVKSVAARKNLKVAVEIG